MKILQIMNANVVGNYFILQALKTSKETLNTKLQRKCPFCGFPNYTYANFCEECGEKMESFGQLKPNYKLNSTIV